MIMSSRYDNVSKNCNDVIKISENTYLIKYNLIKLVWHLHTKFQVPTTFQSWFTKGAVCLSPQVLKSSKKPSVKKS